MFQILPNGFENISYITCITSISMNEDVSKLSSGQRSSQDGHKQLKHERNAGQRKVMKKSCCIVIPIHNLVEGLVEQ